MAWNCYCGESHDNSVARCRDCGAAAPVVRTPDSDEAVGTLLPNERTLATFGGAITVTTYRVRYEYETFGQSVFKSIMLEEVSSCALARMSYPWLLVVAALCLVGSFAFGGDGGGAWITGVLFAAVCVAVFFFVRREVLAIASAGTEIRLELIGHSQGEARALIDTLERAKDERHRALSGR